MPVDGGLECGSARIERPNCASEKDSGECPENRRKGDYCPTSNMWYFNQQLDSCMVFQYQGCGGNGNRFKTESECMGRCAIRMLTITFFVSFH